MTLWTVASRRVGLLSGIVGQHRPSPYVAVGSARQMSVANNDNILPVSMVLARFFVLI